MRDFKVEHDLIRGSCIECDGSRRFAPWWTEFGGRPGSGPRSLVVLGDHHRLIRYVFQEEINKRDPGIEVEGIRADVPNIAVEVCRPDRPQGAQLLLLVCCRAIGFRSFFADGRVEDWGDGEGGGEALVGELDDEGARCAAAKDDHQEVEKYVA